MSIYDILVALVIGALAGWLAGLRDINSKIKKKKLVGGKK